LANNLKLETFVAALNKETLNEADRAVAIVWFLTHGVTLQQDVTANEIAVVFRDYRMSSSVNVSRLAKNLSKHADTIRGIRRDSFKIKSSSDQRLSEKYGSFSDLSSLPVGDSVISLSINLGSRKILDELRRQINGSYERGFYTATAVLLRRLAEILLIESFDKAGHLDQARDANGEIVMFSELISRAKSKKYLQLSRTAPAALEKIKDIGDTAAHHRYYVTTKKDIDDLNPGAPRLIAELAALSGFH